MVIQIKPGSKVVHLGLFWDIKAINGNKVDLIRKDRRGNENTVNGLDIALIQEKKVLFVTGYEDQKI